MFNRHQAEITVMQFRGHSLLVHQSTSVPWEFFSSSHFIGQFLPTRFPLITAIRMCHLLPVHHLGMEFLAGSKDQNITILIICTHLYCSPVSWGCRTHQLHLCRGVRIPQWVSWYDTKQSDGEAPVMLKLWGMQSTPSLLFLPGPLWPGVVAPDRVLSMG